MAVESSGLFDAAYYLAQVPEATEHADGPIAHYLGTTGVQAYRPHPLFDARYYIDTNFDLKVCAAEINPLLHYLLHGALEGRDPHPLFSSQFYFQQCPQLYEQRQNPLVHFLTSQNCHSISPHELFDVHYYCDRVPEAGQAGRNPLLHFLESSNFVSPHPIFDPAYYLAQLDCEQRGNPLLHFLTSDEGKVSSPHPLFDVTSYLMRETDVARSGAHAFLHYVRFGYLEGRDPNRYFHSLWYLSKHPELQGKGINPLLHYVSNQGIPHPFFDPQLYLQRYQTPVGVDALTDCLSHDRLDELFVDEPLLGEAACGKSAVPISNLDRAYDLLLAATEEPYSHLIVMPGMPLGGSERGTCTIIEALQQRYGQRKVLVLYTECDQHPALQWLPEGTRYIDIRELCSRTRCEHNQAALLVTALIIRRPPKAVHNSLCIKSLRSFCDHWRTLKSISRYVLYLYGYGIFFEEGDPFTWHYNLGEGLRLVDCVVTDTDILRELVEKKVPEAGGGSRKCVTIKAATHKNLKRLLSVGCSSEKIEGGHVLWASRLVAGKRPDILAAIAARMPDIEFLVYGSTDGDPGKGAAMIQLLEAQPNVKYKGAYNDLAELDHRNACALIYTTESDGMAIVVQEATALGLPVIAPKVGGIPEFVSEETGWLIDCCDEVDAYVQALRSVLRQPDEARRRVRAAQALIRSNYSAEALKKVLDGLPEFF